MAQKLVTFSDIYAAIRETLGIQSSDTPATNKIKRIINMIYVDEIAPFKRWNWLEKHTKAVHKAYYGTGTAAVTPDSTTVTLSVAPSASYGSFKGYKFSIDDSARVYEISAHTAESTTITLSSAYQETLDADATFKIWRDKIDLPTGAKETVEILHAEQSKPLEAVGIQGMRKLEASNPKVEGYPTHYSTTDFFDPTADTDETESDRYRQVRVYPAITASPITLNIDYIEEVTELEDDDDEPLMPIGDRIVLFYGACAQAYSVILRDEEMHDRYYAKFQAKLARMAGERDDGMDTPTLAPKSNYINSIRRGGLRRRVMAPGSAGGGSAYAAPTYARDITIEGATITDDVTVSAGVLIDGRDLSEDGAIIDAAFTTTSVTLLDNTSTTAAVTWDITEYTVAHITYSLTRGSGNVQTGTISIISDGTSAYMTEFGIVSAGTPGVTFTVDVQSGSIRLLYTTTSTGTNATMKYRMFNWLA